MLFSMFSATLSPSFHMFICSVNRWWTLLYPMPVMSQMSQTVYMILIIDVLTILNWHLLCLLSSLMSVSEAYVPLKSHRPWYCRLFHDSSQHVMHHLYWCFLEIHPKLYDDVVVGRICCQQPATFACLYIKKNNCNSFDIKTCNAFTNEVGQLSHNITPLLWEAYWRLRQWNLTRTAQNLFEKPTISDGWLLWWNCEKQDSNIHQQNWCETLTGNRQRILFDKFYLNTLINKVIAGVCIIPSPHACMVLLVLNKLTIRNRFLQHT